MTDKFPALNDNKVVQQLSTQTPLFWPNPHRLPASEGLTRVGFTLTDVQDAAERLQRFAPLIAEAFPESRARGGIIESDIVCIPAMQQALAQ